VSLDITPPVTSAVASPDALGIAPVAAQLGSGPPGLDVPSGAMPASPAKHRGNATLIAVGLVAVLAGTALFLSGWSLGRQAALTPGTPISDAQAFQPFWDTYAAIVDRYAGGDVDRKTLVEGAIKGMIGSLDDPYSQYLTSDEFKKSLQGISGAFEGIGATIGTVDDSGVVSTCTTISPSCRLSIMEPIAGSPAAKAGLRAGDVISRIDGTPLDGLTLQEAQKRVRGPRNTTVDLTIDRAGIPLELAITRALVIQPEVTTKDLDDGTVGYIKLSGFSDAAAKDFDAAVATDVSKGEKGILVDLRGNPGGFVTAARDIASQFLAGGTVFWQEDAAGNLTDTVALPGGAATDPSIKVVVLVDGGTASASEIVAGALHDRGRATLVGQKTFGKGTVQQWTQLEDDNGGFRLTIAKWLTPDKTWVHGKGIVPDIVVTSVATKPGDDPVLDAGLKLLGGPPHGTGAVQPAG
jgi:carboxyl-terminal processing protease